MEMLPKNGKAQTRKELSGYKDEQMVVQTQNPFKTQMKSVSPKEDSYLWTQSFYV